MANEKSMLRSVLGAFVELDETPAPAATKQPVQAPATQVTSGTYGWQHGAVQTYKINDVLAIYAFKNQYQKEIGSFVSCIARNISNLQRTGHPKWRDVDPLAIDSIKWPAHPAAVSAIKRELKAAR